jgi:hypothetical protein
VPSTLTHCKRNIGVVGMDLYELSGFGHACEKLLGILGGLFFSTSRTEGHGIEVPFRVIFSNC